MTPISSLADDNKTRGAAEAALALALASTEGMAEEATALSSVLGW